MPNPYHYCFKFPYLLCTFILLNTAFVRAQVSKGKPPNIIYIYADDLGYGELGCYGQKKIKTPHLDQIAREGIRFTQHYAGAPVCAPSRVMLMTGKHAGHAYIRGNYELGGFADSEEGGQMPLPESIKTLPQLLKQAGYITALCGKWGLGVTGTSGDPLKQGFDYYYSVLDQKQAHNYYPTHLWENGRWDTLGNSVINVHKNLDSATAKKEDFERYKGIDYSIDKFTEKALSFIDKNKSRPFFLYLAYTLPHVSLQIPDGYLKDYIGQFDESPYYGQRGYAAQWFPKSAYAAMVSYLDRQAGLILRKILEVGLDKNTIIMFSSDNGSSVEGGADPSFFEATGGLRGVKRDLYEGGIRVPFIARWPGKIKAGVVSDHLSAQYDLMATLAELTGQTTGDTDGISFLPTLLGQHERQNKHEWLYFEFPEKGGQVAVRMGKWKAVRTEIRKDRNSAWQIFDLSNDPYETRDIASQHPELVRKISEIQQREHQHPHIREWEFLDPKFELK